MITKYRTEIEDSYRTIVVKEKEVEYDVIRMDSPQKIVDMLNYIFRMDRLAEEHCYLLCMNVKCRIIGVYEIGHGTVNSALVSTRDVFMKALMLGASGIVIAHNHPSGDASFSESDLNLYKRFKSAAELMEVKLLDFIAIGRNQYSSASEQNI